MMAAVTRMCSKCGKPLRKRYWFGFIGDSAQCDRLFCRLRSGHWFWFTFHRRIVWEPWVTIRRPRLKKGP